MIERAQETRSALDAITSGELADVVVMLCLQWWT
jgi:hypothetical protein